MMNYITKIKAKVGIYATKKTSNVFDGSYKSVYKGSGMNFEDLREYVPGDNIRDIDWKASSRSNNILVKRYVAEKKHNIMLVFDTGRKMSAHTCNGEVKKELALQMGGTIGYMAAQNGDNVGCVFNRNGMVDHFIFRAGLFNLERILTEYDKEKDAGYESELEKSLLYIINNINRKMILFIITDASGIQSISESVLKKLTCRHDVLLVDIGDANLAEKKSYSVDADHYVLDFLASNKKLRKLEKETKERIQKENESKLIQYRIVSSHIDTEEDIVEKVVDLLERHKYANIR